MVEKNTTLHICYFFQPDSSVEPFFTTLVKEGHVDNIFAIQLCGPNKTGTQGKAPESTEAEVAGTMVGTHADRPIEYRSDDITKRFFFFFFFFISLFLDTMYR